MPSLEDQEWGLKVLLCTNSHHQYKLSFPMGKKKVQQHCGNTNSTTTTYHIHTYEVSMHKINNNDHSKFC